MAIAPTPERTAIVDDQLEDAIFRIGKRLEDARPRRGGVRLVDDYVTRRISGHAPLRAAFYRAVDVAPVCRGPRDLGAHFASFLGQDGRRSGLRFAARTCPARGLGTALSLATRITGRRFIVAASPTDALPYLRELWDRDIEATLDLLGEAVVRSVEADEYASRCVAALDALGRAASNYERDPSTALFDTPRPNLSVKPSALTARIRPWAPEVGARDAAPRLRAILRRAREINAHVHMDAESLDTRETMLALTASVLTENEFREGPSVGVVLQAYLRDSADVARHVLEVADRREVPLSIRLVKGAYWDHEWMQSIEHGQPQTVFESRRETDRNFELVSRLLLNARPRIRLAIGSHNVRSISHALACADQTQLGRAGLEFQVLRGLGDELALALNACGAKVRVYTPVGDLVAGMAYLVRRLLENTSNDSFLVARDQKADLETLLRRP